MDRKHSRRGKKVQGKVGEKKFACVPELPCETPQRDDPQGLGSAITYQRRYALGAILFLNIDEDDDAEKASAPPFLQPDRRYYDDEAGRSTFQVPLFT